MESISEVLMLKRLYFGCTEPMAWWNSYSYSLEAKQGKVYLLSSSANIDKEKGRTTSEMEVPISVLENLSEIARAGGAVGSPKWENSYDGTVDAPMYDYDLYWTDGTRTGPGTAAKHIMKYLQILGKKCVEAALLCKPLPENTGNEIALLLKEETAPPISKNSDGQPQKMWICAICGGTESTEKFCMECGAKK